VGNYVTAIRATSLFSTTARATTAYPTTFRSTTTRATTPFSTTPRAITADPTTFCSTNPTKIQRPRLRLSGRAFIPKIDLSQSPHHTSTERCSKAGSCGKCPVRFQNRRYEGHLQMVVASVEHVDADWRPQVGSRPPLLPNWASKS
jgi:hypothetical protein